MPLDIELSDDWRKDCLHWRGLLLVGVFSHWCFEWDGLPVDETTDEFSCCQCFAEKKENP